MDSDNEDIVEILHIDFSLAISNPFGAVSHACMTARGRLLPIRLDADRGIHFNTGVSPRDFGWEASCFAPRKVLLNFHSADHDDTAHTPLFFLLVKVDRTASRPQPIIPRAGGDASTSDTFHCIGYMDPHGIETHLRSVGTELLYDTVEP
jgi:hypothetical protein